MSPLDLSRLSGPDAVIALRSYPRRYRSAVLPVDDPDVEDTTYQIGSGGHSALDLVVHATNSLVLLTEGLRQILLGTDPILHPGVLDHGEREWTVPPGTSIHDALGRFEDASTALAERITGIEMPGWNRTGRVAGNGEITVLDLVKEAVRTGAAGLSDIDATLTEIRAR